MRANSPGSEIPDAADLLLHSKGVFPEAAAEKPAPEDGRIRVTRLSLRLHQRAKNSSSF